MTIPPTPYIAGDSVGDSPAFVGRTDILEEVLAVMRDERASAILLYGQRRIGKTSILQYLEKELPTQGAYCPVYFDLQDQANKSLNDILRELVRTVTHRLKLPATDLGQRPRMAFRREWLSAVLSSMPTNAALVILFDEFDVLSGKEPANSDKDSAAEGFFSYLGRLLTKDPRHLKFVFAIGRNVDDLDNDTIRSLKATTHTKVSLLEREETDKLVRLSEVQGTLAWSAPAVERVYELTHGHPFLTQHLCRRIFLRAYAAQPDAPPPVTPEDVDAAVSKTLEAAHAGLVWLWDGLGPAEHIVASALAEAGPEAITERQLEQVLQDSGVRTFMSELKDAQQALQKWDLVEPAGDGYRFRVELLRRWFVNQQPLRKVQKALDEINPIADNLYKTALQLYRTSTNRLPEAAETASQALKLNPNHAKARLLLAEIQLTCGQPSEAREHLERLYEHQPAEARPRLIQALFAEAKDTDNYVERLRLYGRVQEIEPNNTDLLNAYQDIVDQAKTRLYSGQYKEARKLLERLYDYQPTLVHPHLVEAMLAEAHFTDYEESLQLYGRVQEIEPDNPEVLKAYQDIIDLVQGWLSQGKTDEALKMLEPLHKHQQAIARDPLATALLIKARTTRLPDERNKIYERVIDVSPQHKAAVRREMFDLRMAALRTLEENRDFREALVEAYKMASEYPEMLDWSTELDRLKSQAYWVARYQQAETALQNREWKKAQTLLKQVIAKSHFEKPSRDQAVRHLRRAEIGSFVAKSHFEKPSREQAVRYLRRAEIGSFVTSWNPLNGLRLIWLSLISPEQISDYEQTFEENLFGAGLLSAPALMWLPFLIPPVALGIGTLSFPEGIEWCAGLSGAAGVLAYMILQWVIAAGTDLDVEGFGCLIIPILIIVSLSVAVCVAVIPGNSLTSNIAYPIAISIANVITTTTAFGIILARTDTGVLAASIMAYTLCGGALGTASYFMGNTLSESVSYISTAVGIATGILLVTMITMGVRAITTEKLPRVCMISLTGWLVGCAFLVWFCLLGGWRLFQ